MAKDFVQLTTAKEINFIDLTLPESLDSEEFDKLNESVLKTLDSKTNQRWVLDLSAVSYMGSSVLGLMINLRQHIKSGGGQLVLCGLSARLKEIFHTCCLERLFTIVKSRADAVKALGAK